MSNVKIHLNERCGDVLIFDYENMTGCRRAGVPLRKESRKQTELATPKHRSEGSWEKKKAPRRGRNFIGVDSSRVKVGRKVR